MIDSIKGKRILIVEDDVTNMAVYAVSLKRHGAIVIQDFWNTDTINTIRMSQPIDIILLDLMLRYKMSGYDIIAKIKADPELAKIPVLAVSAADPGIEIPKTKKAGFSGFVGKPIDPIKFPNQIVDVMNGKPIWHAPQGLLEDFA